MLAPRNATDSTTTGTTTHQNAILAIICVSYFMVILDNSIIFTGLPRIESSMHFSPTGLTWVQDAYTLVFGGLLLLGARAGDNVGRRRMFILGLTLFGGASFLVGAAPFSWWLIAARAFQGIGAAILAPSSLALLTATFPEGHRRGRAVAAYSAVAGIGASLGLVDGGVLADLISWRAGFFLNVPIGLAMLVAARRCVAETPPRGGRFDLIGALCATLGMSALVFGVIESTSVGWAAPRVLAALIVGLVLLVGLVVNEARVDQPIMPLRLFASRQRTGAYLTRMLYLAAIVGFFFFTTQYLQGVLGFSPLQAGLAFLPISAVNFAAALAVTRFIRRLGSTLINTFHQLGSALGLGILATVGAAAVPASASGVAALVDRVSAALTGGTIMLAIALVAVIALMTRRRTTRPAQPPAEQAVERIPVAAVLELHR